MASIIPKQPIPVGVTQPLAPPPKQLLIKLPSVQSLLIELIFEGAHGVTKISSATGFVCISPRGPVLVTNWHNVSGINPTTGKHLSPTLAQPNKVVITHNAKQLGQFVKIEERLRDDHDTPLWVEHPVWGREADMVALKLINFAGVTLFPYDTKKDQDVEVSVSEVVSVVGFPFGIGAAGTAIWATGTVASEPQLDYDSRPVFLIDCKARTGQSGSAVIAHRQDGHIRRPNVMAFGGEATRLMGIYSGRINAESDLGRVWKTSAIDKLLAVVR